MEEKIVLPVDEVAKKLGIARANAYALCKSQGFPAIQLTERRIVVPTEAFMRWLAERAQIGNN